MFLKIILFIRRECAKSGHNVFMGSSVDVDATLRFVLNNIHLQRPTYCYNYTLYNRPLDLNDWHEQRVSLVQKTVKDFENRQLGSIQMQREFINLKKNRMFSKEDNLLDIWWHHQKLKKSQYLFLNQNIFR